MDDDDLYIDLDSKVNSGWKEKRSVVQNRKKGWMKRLRTNMNKGKVEVVDYKAKSERGTNFPQVKIDLTTPVKPRVEDIESLGGGDHCADSVLCMVCFNYVSIGNERIVCEHCPVVIHLSCISNIKDYVTEGFRSQHSHGRKIDPIADNVRWTCAFCIHDVKKMNNHNMNKYEKAMSRHNFKKAVVRLQSMFRMLPLKRAFARQVLCAKIIQKLHRNRHYREAIVRDRMAERRCVRLRIHEIIAYVEDPKLQKHSDGPPKDLNEKVFLKMDTNHFSTWEINNSGVPLEVESIGVHNIEAKEKKTSDLKKMIVSNMFMANNGGLGSAVTLEGIDKGSFPNKTFFLTVIVNKSDNMMQVYRVDLPLKEIHEFCFGEAAEEKMVIIERVNAMCEGNPLAYEHVAKIRLYPPRPYVVFPACMPGVIITLMLSRVTEWPLAQYICEQSFSAENALVWRQLTCMSHGMLPSHEPVIPTQMRRLQIFVDSGCGVRGYNIKGDQKKKKKMKNVVSQFKKLSGVGEVDSDGDSVVSCDTVESIASKCSSSNSGTIFPNINKRTGIKSHRNKVVTSARILWTLIPSPNSGVIVGFVNFFSHDNPTSNSVKYWCVVVDKCLLVYKSVSDNKPPSECINLTECECLITSKDIIRLYRQSDRQIWFCQGANVHKRHDWVAWIQCACRRTK